MSATLTRRWLGGRSHARPIGLPLLFSVTEVAARTGDVEFVRQYHEDREDRRREQEATKFREQNPNYFRSEKNYERLSSYLDQHNMEFTAENLARAFRALRSSGHLQFDVNKPQPLTTEQLIYVARLAARG